MSKSQGPPTPAIPCPSCGEPAVGRFCTECGAAVREARCQSCGAPLTPGAKFCHDCGAPAGAGTGAAVRAAAQRAPRPAARPVAATAAPRSNLPWILAGIAFVAAVVIFAAQRAGQEPVTPSAPMGGGAGGAAGVDISQMTPQERASRLFDRVMRLSEEGKRDSAAFFASMATGVYESLGPLDLDMRYDYGRVAEVSGSLDLAQAQADSILREAPDHLLGLILSASVAAARGDETRRAEFERRLIAAEPAQRARGLEEYLRHKADIDNAIAAARSRR